MPLTSDAFIVQYSHYPPRGGTLVSVDSAKSMGGGLGSNEQQEMEYLWQVLRRHQLTDFAG